MLLSHGARFSQHFFRHLLAPLPSVHKILSTADLARRRRKHFTFKTITAHRHNLKRMTSYPNAGGRVWRRRTQSGQRRRSAVPSSSRDNDNMDDMMALRWSHLGPANRRQRVRDLMGARGVISCGGETPRAGTCSGCGLARMVTDRRVGRRILSIGRNCAERLNLYAAYRRQTNPSSRAQQLLALGLYSERRNSCGAVSGETIDPWESRSSEEEPTDQDWSFIASEDDNESVASCDENDDDYIPSE